MEPNTLTVDAGLWALFVGLLAMALVFAWPRPPAWDPVLFHTVVLATLHRGELEAAKKELPDWQARLAKALPSGPRPPSGGWTEDPTMLGDAYAPSVRIGAACTWDGLAADEKAANEALDRRVADVELVWLGRPAFPIPHLPNRDFGESNAESLLAKLPSPATRVVLATQEPAHTLLTLLVENPLLRDRVRAVLLLGSATTSPGPASQAAYETEVDRVVPWFTLRIGDAPPWPSPPIPPSGRHSFQIHDLGTIPEDELAGPHVARSLAILLAAS